MDPDNNISHSNTPPPFRFGTGVPQPQQPRPTRQETDTPGQASATAAELQKIVGDANRSVMHSLSDRFGTITQSLDQLKTLVEQANSLASEKQRIIADQHALIERFQSDLLLKTQRPLLMELINIADTLDTIAEQQQAHPNYDTLLQSVADLKRWVLAVLSDHAVEPFTTELQPGQPLEKGNRQQLVATEPTTDPALDRGYRSYRPGYIWTTPYLVASTDTRLQEIIRLSAAPQGFSFVIRPEQLVALRYRQPEPE